MCHAVCSGRKKKPFATADAYFKIVRLTDTMKHLAALRFSLIT